MSDGRREGVYIISGECVNISQHHSIHAPGLDVMDDDSVKLGEIVELFSDVTLPLKVEKLIKVSVSIHQS